MPSDRQWRRAVLLAMGIVCTTISTGCLTSPFARRGNESAPEPGSSASATPVRQANAQISSEPGRLDSSVRSASVRATDVSAGATTLATPFITGPGAPSPAPAAEFPLEVPGASSGKPIPAAPAASAHPPQTEPAPPPSTPLLDSYIQRVADVTRQQREAIESSPGPTPESADDQKLLLGTVPILATLSPGMKTGAPDRDAIPLPDHLSRDPREDLLAGEPIVVCASTPADAAAQRRPGPNVASFRAA